MIQEILKYKKITEDIEQLIKDSHFKTQYIIKTAGLKSATFYRKLKTKTFTPDELLKIAEILNPKEAILIEIQKAEKDILEGKYTEHKHVMNQLRNDFL